MQPPGGMKALPVESVPAPSFFRRLYDGMFAAFDSLIPYGYEDESGFHFGPNKQPEAQVIRFRPARSLRRSSHCHSTQIRTIVHPEPAARVISFR